MSNKIRLDRLIPNPTESIRSKKKPYKCYGCRKFNFCGAVGYGK